MMAEDRVNDLEAEVRVKKRKMDRMNYSYGTSMDRIQDRVYYYPTEEGQAHYTLSRGRMIARVREERVEAINRGL